MARRPIFLPNPDSFPYVREVPVEFDWHPGFSRAQAQKSIASLHHAAAKLGISSILEISSKSPDPLGVALSAFNLTLEVPGNRSMSVECAFQGSKVFEHGGPYTDLYSVSSKQARTDGRLHSSGNLVAFNFLGEDFPTCPVTAFYDWLYITALWQNAELSQIVLVFQGFSDIAFNPKRSINCQAHSAALFVSMYQQGVIEHIVQDRGDFIRLVSGKSPRAQTAYQPNLL
jgi:hypothetical protein